MQVASTLAHLNASRIESLSSSVNPEFGLHKEDPSFESDSSSESDYDTR